MKSYIKEDTFVVHLTNAECITLGQGTVIGDRLNPLALESKVEVYPYSELDPAFSDVQEIMSGPIWDERVHRALSVARFLTNVDLLLFVPQEVPRFSLISGEHIPKARIETMVSGDERTTLLSTLPENGIWLRFG